MLMAYLTLITGLLISAVAIFYSVAGLISIFSAAPIAIIIMGTVLEVSKLVATVWLKQNWEIAPRLLKGYLLTAVVVLMFITSMGIFGFLSQAHSDQTLVSGDVQAKVAVYDEKIKTERENIDAARKALSQMDAQVNERLSRSADDRGAERAVQIRRQQQAERTKLQNDISRSQGIIAKLNEERAPIAAEVRKVEAEVGPIKYIASFIYGENPDANLLEKAVTWVIILIVIVFDPLAVMLLLASQYSFGMLKRKSEEEEPEEKEFFDRAREVAQSIDNGTYVAPAYEPDNGPLTDNQIKQINNLLAESRVEPTINYSIIDDAEEELDEPPFKGKGLPPAMPLSTPYQYAEVEEESTSTVNIIHTADSMIVEDTAGTQEIPAYNIDELKELIATHGYSVEHGMAKSNGVEFPESVLDKIVNSGYVQNEEQKESDQWTKIVNKTITEEEYLKAVQQKKDA
jgi:biopolymer transport protein ExbB/TolQ